MTLPPPAHGPALQACGITVRRGHTVAVQDVSVSVDRGTWLAVVGPNGAGKTSLLLSLAGLVAADGCVQVDGRSLHGLAGSERARHVALVPQSPTIPPGMTVADYVLLGRTAHISRFGSETATDLNAVAVVLERLQLESLSHRVLSTLSGGERQRACIARAVVQEASVLLLDEPTVGLDLRHQLGVLDLIDELRGEHSLTVISTLHDLTLAAQYADTLLLLDHGNVAVHGTPGEVLTDSVLERHYGRRVKVIRDGEHLIVVPVRH